MKIKMSLTDNDIEHWIAKATASKKRGTHRMQMSPDFAIAALAELKEIKKLKAILGEQKVEYILSCNE